MGKNISFLFLCFCLLMCGNISKGFGEETNNCEFYSNEYEKFHNEDYANFINLINPDSIKPEGSTQLICKIEGDSYTPNTCADIFNKINEYETKFEENDCSYKPSELICDKLEFDFVANFTNANCTTLSTNTEEETKKCYDFLSSIDKTYRTKYKKNGCKTDKLLSAKNYICNFYKNDYEDYLNKIGSNNDLICEPGKNTNCQKIIDEINQKYIEIFKNNNCPVNFKKEATCKVIEFEFFLQSATTCICKNSETGAIEINSYKNLTKNCIECEDSLDKYLTNSKKNNCSIDEQLEKDFKSYREANCTYYNNYYNQTIINSCTRENNTDCKTATTEINNYISYIQNNNCLQTEESENAKCKEIEFGFNIEASGKSCEINNVDDKLSADNCSDFVSVIEKYLKEYDKLYEKEGIECKVKKEMQEYKNNYGSAVCSFYSAEYQNYLKKVAFAETTSTECKEAGNDASVFNCNINCSADCKRIENDLKTYVTEFNNNNCSDYKEFKELSCELTGNIFMADLLKSTCKNATIDNPKDILKCRQFTEMSYKKYLPQYEKNNCDFAYKCGLFYHELDILIKNYYSTCKQSIDNSSIDNNAKKVLANCSEAVFDLEQFYLRVKKYSCEDIMNQTLTAIKQYNEHVNDLINIGNGGIKSNGIARGLCYAINIVSGPFGKAVASLFIILLGMSFLSGRSESLSFKNLISIAFALALIFGSGHLANIISRNIYSCKNIISSN